MDKAIAVFEKLSKCKTPGKKKKMLEKVGISGGALATGVLIGGSILPKPRKTAMSFQTSPDGKVIPMKKLINLPKPK